MARDRFPPAVPLPRAGQLNALQEKVYRALPVWAQNAAITLHGLRLKWREFDRGYEKLLRQFERQQWYTRSELEAFQNEKLRSIVRHAYDTVPFYRRHFDENNLVPSDVRVLSDLHKVPPVESDILRYKADDLVSNEAGPRDRIVGHTSGTTGQPKRILYDRQVCRAKNAADYRLKRSAGVDLGDPIAFLMGRSGVPIEQEAPPFWRDNHGLNHRLFSIFHLSPSRYDLYIDALQEFGADAIDGYPSTISMFAEAVKVRSRSPALKAAFMSSEVALPYQRRAIEEAFDCETFDYYGLAERAVFATECEHHRGLHVNSDFGLCELLDEENEPVGEAGSGRIVITGWHNRTMPLIRYKTNDWATLADEPCSCGRAFPLLSSIDGRQDDQIATPDGRYLDVSFAYEIMKPVDHGVAESQILQEEDGAVVVKIVPRSNVTEDEIDQVVGGFRRYMGQEAEVRLEICDSIPRDPSGKLRWLVSRVPRTIA